jgi:hypothetical protein
MTRDGAHAGFTGESFFSPRAKKWPDAIIPAQRIAASKNETSGLLLGHQ